MNLPSPTSKQPATFRPTPENEAYLEKIMSGLKLGKDKYNLEVDVSKTAAINFCINECREKGMIGSMELMINNISGPTEVHAHMARQCMEQAFEENVPDKGFLSFLGIWKSKLMG